MYLKTGAKYLETPDSFITYNVGYWYLDEYFMKEPDKNILLLLPDNITIKTNKELYICVIEKYFYLYSKIVELMDINIFSKQYVTLNIYDKLVVSGLAEGFPNISYNDNMTLDDNYKLIFRQPIRRY
jgi:hypothetical protein